VLAAYLVTLLNNALIIAPSPLNPTLRADLGVAHAQVGGLVSAVLLTIMLVQLPAGWLIDRWDNRRIVTAATVGLALSAVPAVLLPTYEMLLAQRLLAGALTAFIFVPLGNLVSRATYPNHARALGLFLAGPPSGMAVGLLAAPTLATISGWPFALQAFAFLVPLPVVLLLRAARSLDLSGSGFTPRRYLGLFRRRELWIIGLAFACTYSGYIFYVSWMPAYLVAANLDLVLAGLVAALIPAVGILARPLGGWAVAGAFRRDKRVPIALGFVGVAAVTVAVMSLPPSWGALLLPLAGFLAQFPFSAYYVYAREVMPPPFSGSALSFLNATSLVGGTITPYAAGLLRDVTGGFGAAFQMLVGISLLGTVIVLGIRRSSGAP
jgi:NNP family nitrate/nitrite transporter-like MFS transporter